MRRGYRRVRGDFSPYRADLDLEAAAAAVPRQELLGVLRGYFTQRASTPTGMRSSVA